MKAKLTKPTPLTFLGLMGTEPMTFGSTVQPPNHYTTEELKKCHITNMNK